MCLLVSAVSYSILTSILCLLHCSRSLYQKIDTEKLQCLNEAEEGSGKKVFRPWDERLDKSKVDQILFQYNLTLICNSKAYSSFLGYGVCAINF